MDKAKTAFEVGPHDECNRLYNGLCNTPATFQGPIESCVGVNMKLRHCLIATQNLKTIRQYMCKLELKNE